MSFGGRRFLNSDEYQKRNFKRGSPIPPVVGKSVSIDELRVSDRSSLKAKTLILKVEIKIGFVLFSGTVSILNLDFYIRWLCWPSILFRSLRIYLFTFFIYGLEPKFKTFVSYINFNTYIGLINFIWF